MKVCYEDNHIIIVYKPRNLLSQKDYTNDSSLVEEVKEYLKNKYNKPGNVYLGLLHRLDRVVGGIMLLAKTSKAAERLSKDIQDHKINKTYLAVVHDNNLKGSDTFIDYILKKDTNSIIDKNGKYSKLDYQVLERYQNYALVKISLETGRHHQIRLQFSSRNHPIYGDYRYGNKEKGGIALMCYSLEFIHPVTKEYMKFSYIDKEDISAIFNNFKFIQKEQ